MLFRLEAWGKSIEGVHLFTSPYMELFEQQSKGPLVFSKAYVSTELLSKQQMASVFRSLPKDGSHHETEFPLSWTIPRAWSCVV